MSSTVITRPARTRPMAGPAKAGVRGGWLPWLTAVLSALESRRRLAEMDERMLRDIGVSFGEAQVEAARAPWDLEAPARHPRRR